MREIDRNALDWVERRDARLDYEPDVAPGPFTPTDPGPVDASGDWRAALEFDPVGSTVRDGDTDYAAEDLARIDPTWAQRVANHLDAARRNDSQPAADANNEACALLLASEDNLETAIDLLKAVRASSNVAADNLRVIGRHLGVDL